MVLYGATLKFVHQTKEIAFKKSKLYQFTDSQTQILKSKSYVPDIIQHFLSLARWRWVVSAPLCVVGCGWDPEDQLSGEGLLGPGYNEITQIDWNTIEIIR